MSEWGEWYRGYLESSLRSSQSQQQQAMGERFKKRTMEEDYEQTHKEISDSALDVQVGGDHYKKCGIQPITYIHANKIGFMEGNAIKYLSRWRDKGGVDDLKKAKHYIEMLIELEGK